MTETKEAYVVKVTPGAALAQYRGCQQALGRTLRELVDARAEIEALRAEVNRLGQLLSQAQEDERWRCALICDGHYYASEAAQEIRAGGAE